MGCVGDTEGTPECGAEGDIQSSLYLVTSPVDIRRLSRRITRSAAFLNTPPPAEGNEQDGAGGQSNAGTTRGTS